MLERLLIVLVVSALLALGALLVRRWAAARTEAATALHADTVWQALGARPDGRPTVVAFSTPSCAACHTAQAPALQVLEQQLGPESVRVVKVNAAERPEVAWSFRIMTVPSTVVLSAEGQVAAINHGFAPADRLAAQLASAG